MTKEYKRLKRIATKCLHDMGMDLWDVEFILLPEEASRRDCLPGQIVIMDVLSRWDRMQIQVRVNPEWLNDKSITDIQMYDELRHEFIHTILEELRNNPKDNRHEERVVAQLQIAFRRTYKKGFEDGRKNR